MDGIHVGEKGEVVRFIASKEREENLGMEIEEALRKVIKADREDFDRKLKSIKANYEREVRILRRENARLIQILRNRAEKRPAEKMAPKLLQVLHKS